MAKPTAAERVTHPAALQAQPMGIITEADMIESLSLQDKVEWLGWAALLTLALLNCFL